jgi:hypothetical protein
MDQILHCLDGSELTPVSVLSCVYNLVVLCILRTYLRFHAGSTVELLLNHLMESEPRLLKYQTRRTAAVRLQCRFDVSR